MSTAVLNVWISNLGDPCTVANDTGSGIPYHWSVAVLDCCGRVLNWSEGRFRFHRDDPWHPIPKHTPAGGKTEGWWYEMIPARDGHVEIEVPPGCYSVVGSMHTWFVDGILHGNWATDRAIVTASCSADACVRLYASSFQPCNVILGRRVIPLLVNNKVITREQGDAAMRALAVLEKPEALSQFERGYLEVLQRAFDNMDKPSPLEPKR
jgi:hypothetical protein